VDVPCTHGFRDAEVDLPEGAWTESEGVFWFPLDEAYEQALAQDGWEDSRRHRGGRTEVRVGYVYLTVGVGARYALFTLSAATSDMSVSFEDAEAVRRWAAGFVERSGGLPGLLDREWVYFPLLTQPDAYVVLDEDVLNRAGPDAWVEAALAAPVQHGRAAATRAAVSRKGRNVQPSSSTAFRFE